MQFAIIGVVATVFHDICMTPFDGIFGDHHFSHKVAHVDPDKPLFLSYISKLGA